MLGSLKKYYKAERNFRKLDKQTWYMALIFYTGAEREKDRKIQVKVVNATGKNM